MKVMAVVFACLAPVAVAEERAKDIFDAAIKKFAVEPRSVQFSFQVELSGSSKGSIKGTLAVLRAKDEGVGDKLRFEFSGSVDEKAGKTLVVSDGKKVKTVETDRETIERDVPKKLQTNILSLSVCGGALFGPNILCSGNVSSETADPILAGAAGFSVGAGEKIDGKETKVVEFDIESPDHSPGKCHNKLFVDAATSIPLKIVLTMSAPSGPVTITETWKEVKLNAEIADKVFELP